MSEKRNFRGVWIPADIWLNKDLTLQEKVMLIEIDSLQDEVRGCYKSNSGFADFFGLSASRVSRIISSLEEKGYIQVEQVRQGRRIVERRIFIIANLSSPPKTNDEKVLPKQQEPIAETHRTLLPKRHEPYCGNDKGSNTYIGNTVEGKQTGVDDDQIIDAQDSGKDRFDEFWNAYPNTGRRVGKSKCRERWKKLKLDSIADKIIEHVMAMRETTAWKSGYEPATTTYLHQKRWEDGIPTETPILKNRSDRNAEAAAQIKAMSKWADQQILGNQQTDGQGGFLE